MCNEVSRWTQRERIQAAPGILYAPDRLNGADQTHRRPKEVPLGALSFRLHRKLKSVDTSHFWEQARTPSEGGEGYGPTPLTENHNCCYRCCRVASWRVTVSALFQQAPSEPCLHLSMHTALQPFHAIIFSIMDDT